MPVFQKNGGGRGCSSLAEVDDNQHRRSATVSRCVALPVMVGNLPVFPPVRTVTLAPHVKEPMSPLCNRTKGVAADVRIASMHECAENKAYAARPVYYSAPGEVIKVADLNGNTLQELAEVIGVEATLAFASYFGGCRVWISNPQQPDDPLRLIGKDIANQIAEFFGSLRLEVPKQALNHRALRRLVRARAKAGEAADVIARDLNISYRTVTRMTGGCRGGQPTSFVRLRLIDGKLERAVFKRGQADECAVYDQTANSNGTLRPINLSDNAVAMRG